MPSIYLRGSHDTKDEVNQYIYISSWSKNSPKWEMVSILMGLLLISLQTEATAKRVCEKVWSAGCQLSNARKQPQYNPGWAQFSLTLTLKNFKKYFKKITNNKTKSMVCQAANARTQPRKWSIEPNWAQFSYFFFC